MSLPPNLAPHTSSQTDVLIYTDPPTIFDASSESEEGQESEHTGELDMSIPSVVELHDLDDLNAILQESCEEEVEEPTTVEFHDDILSVEYESFSWGFNFDENFDEGFCVEYE